MSSPIKRSPDINSLESLNKRPCLENQPKIIGTIETIASGALSQPQLSSNPPTSHSSLSMTPSTSSISSSSLSTLPQSSRTLFPSASDFSGLFAITSGNQDPDIAQNSKPSSSPPPIRRSSLARRALSFSNLSGTILPAAPTSSNFVLEQQTNPNNELNQSYPSLGHGVFSLTPPQKSSSSSSSSSSQVLLEQLIPPPLLATTSSSTLFSLPSNPNKPKGPPPAPRKTKNEIPTGVRQAMLRNYELGLPFQVNFHDKGSYMNVYSALDRPIVYKILLSEHLRSNNQSVQALIETQVANYTAARAAFVPCATLLNVETFQEDGYLAYEQIPNKFAPGWNFNENPSLLSDVQKSYLEQLKTMLAIICRHELQTDFNLSNLRVTENGVIVLVDHLEKEESWLNWLAKGVLEVANGNRAILSYICPPNLLKEATYLLENKTQTRPISPF